MSRLTCRQAFVWAPLFASTQIAVIVCSLLVAGFSAGCGRRNDAPIAVDEYSRSFGDGSTPLSTEKTTQWVGPNAFTVAPGVYVLGDMSPSAVYAIDTGAGVILIDSGVDESGRLLRESLIRVGLSIEDVRYVLLTHAHYDHVFGANKVREVSGAVVCAGRGDCDVLRDADTVVLFSLFPRTPYSGRPIPIDRELAGEEEIKLGDCTIRVISTPGHTPGSTCYLMTKGQQRILFSGDTIASVNLGPATYPVNISPRFRGDAAAYLRTVERLVAMPTPDLLLPGHPRQQARFQSMEMETADWTRMLEAAASELKTVVSRQRSDGRDSLDDSAKEIEKGLYYLGTLESVAVYCLVNGEDVIAVNAPGGDAFAAFLVAAMNQLGLESKQPDAVLLTSTQDRFCSGLKSLSPTTPVTCGSDTTSVIEAGAQRVLSIDSLADAVGLPIEAVPLDDGRDAIAYSLSIGDRDVLWTPNVPRNIAMVWRDRINGLHHSGLLQPQSRELIDGLAESDDASSAYKSALETLSQRVPDVWLPSVPMSGQNANLYDDDWQIVLDANKMAVSFAWKQATGQ